MYKKNYNNIFINTLEYIFVILTVLQCNSVYEYSTQFFLSKSLINISWQIILVILLVILLDKNGSKVNYDNIILFSFIFFFMMLCFIMYNIIFYPSFSKSYIIKFLIDPILLIMLFGSFNNINEINKLFIKFEKVILFLVHISFIFFLMYILKVPTNSSISLTKWSGRNSAMVSGYFGINYFPGIHSEFLGLNWIRNSSLFVEPSMFSYVLLISLLIELFMRKDRHIFNYRIFIILIAIISTASTTGILVAFPAVIYNALILIKKHNISKSLIILLLPIIIIFLKLVLLDKTNNISTNLGSSSAIRSDDILAGIKTWLKAPLLGFGLGNNDAIRENMSIWRFTSSSIPSESAGFTTMLAQGGLFIGMFYLLPTILSAKISKKLLGLAVFSFIPFIFVVSQGFYIYIMLLAYFWTVLLNERHYKNIMK